MTLDGFKDVECLYCGEHFLAKPEDDSKFCYDCAKKSPIEEAYSSKNAIQMAFKIEVKGRQ